MRISLKSIRVKSKGFTLIEVLISLVILSISLLALAALMGTTTRNTSSGGHLTEATTFAQDKLEELMITPWVQILPNSMNTDTRVGATGITYTRNWANIVQNGDLKTITVAVTWNDQTNHSISLLSAISR